MNSIAFTTKKTLQGIEFVQVEIHHEVGEHTVIDIRMNVHNQTLMDKTLAQTQGELLEKAASELQSFAGRLLVNAAKKSTPES